MTFIGRHVSENERFFPADDNFFDRKFEKFDPSSLKFGARGYFRVLISDIYMNNSKNVRQVFGRKSCRQLEKTFVFGHVSASESQCVKFTCSLDDACQFSNFKNTHPTPSPLS